MADRWHVARDGKQHGPFTGAKLRELASSGRLKPTDMLLKEGMEEWVAASSVKGLFPAVPPLPAAWMAGEPDDESRLAASEGAEGKPSRHASSGRGLLVAGVVGGGVLLAILVGAAVIVAGKRPAPTGKLVADDRRGEKKPPADGGDAVAGGKKWRTRVTKGVAIWGVAYSGDGKHVATSGADRIIRIWDAGTGEERHSLRGHDKDARGIAISPDGSRLASVSWDDTLRIWKPREGRHHRTIPKSAAGYARGGPVAFSPDGTRVATGYHDLRASKALVRVWDADTGEKVVDCIPTNRHGAHGIAYSGDGKRLASCCSVSIDNINYNDGEIKVWDAETGGEERTIPVGGTTTNAIAFSPDGKRVAVGCGRRDSKSKAFVGCEIRIYDLVTKAEPRLLRGHGSPVTSLAYSRDGKVLVSGAGGTALGTPGEVKVWSVSGGEELHSLKGHTNAVTGVAFSPDGKRIVSSSGGERNVNGKTLDTGGEIKLWDAKTGEDLGTLAVEKGSATHPTTDPVATDAPFDHRANTRTALKKRIIEVSYANAVQPVTKTYEAMCKPQRFKAVIGLPDSGDSSQGKNKLWTYRCSDGAITFRVHVLGDSAIQIVKVERE